MSKDLIEDSQIVNNLVDNDWFVFVCVCNDLISIIMFLQKILLFIYHVVSNVFSLCDNREIDVWSIDTRILVLIEDDESIFVAIAYDDVCLTNSIDIEIDEFNVELWVVLHVALDHFVCDEKDQDKMFVWFDDCWHHRTRNQICDILVEINDKKLHHFTICHLFYYFICRQLFEIFDDFVSNCWDDIQFIYVEKILLWLLDCVLDDLSSRDTIFLWLLDFFLNDS